MCCRIEKEITSITSLVLDLQNKQIYYLEAHTKLHVQRTKENQN